MELLAPSRVADERFKAWFTRTQRVDTGPDQVATIVRAAFEGDARQLLPSISCPTSSCIVRTTAISTWRRSVPRRSHPRCTSRGSPR